jgi:hypothetical protein
MEMVERETDNGRVRAWILIRTESPEPAARQLYEELGYEGGDSFVLVRADVVDYHYNIVVPVDAESWEVLQDLFCRIQKLTGARETAIVRVVKHIPYPPHLADGYITEEEAKAYTGPDQIKVGRQGNSPGMNLWG